MENAQLPDETTTKWQHTTKKRIQILLLFLSAWPIDLTLIRVKW